MPRQPQDVAGLVDRRMALTREWDDLVEQVRALPGFADFLRPPELETLLPAAEAGPVVIVNVSRWRCDALIVRRSGVTPCELRRLTAEDTLAWANRYLETLRDAEEAAEAHDAVQGRPGTTMADVQARQRAERALLAAEDATEAMLTQLLGWLWEAIAGPVLAELGCHETPRDSDDWPRVWWCPTGPLTLLPLHAAGFHIEPSDGPRRTVIDRVVSSYTPTLRALEARRPLDPPLSKADRLLVVAPGRRPRRAAARQRRVGTGPAGRVIPAAAH